MEGKNRGNLNMVHQDLTWRVQVESEKTSAETWNHTWGWMLQEYKQMKEKLGQVCNKIPNDKEIDADITNDKVPITREKQDDRSVKPFPETSCGEIGWMSSRREFQLEVHGPSPYTTRIPLHPPKHPYTNK